LEEVGAEKNKFGKGRGLNVEAVEILTIVLEVTKALT